MIATKGPRFLLLFLTLSAGNLPALEYDYSIFATTLYNDNFNSNLEDPSGYSLNSGVSFRVNTDQNSDWILDATGVYSKEYFSLSQLTAQSTNQLAFDLNYDAADSNFSLLLRDDFSQTPQNRTSTQGVNNLTDVNVVTVRPEYFFKLTSLDKLYFEAAHIKSNRTDQSEIVSDGLSFDTKTKIKSVRLERKLNETSEFSFVASETDTDFESDSGANSTDFVQDDRYFRWVGGGTYNQLQIEYGISEIIDEQGRDFDTDLLNVIYSRQINRSHELEASYREGFDVQLSDNSIDDSVIISDDSFGAAQEFNSANLSYIVSGTFISFTFNLFELKFNGTGAETEELRKGVSFNASYSLARVFSTAIDTDIAIDFRKSKNAFTALDGSNINTKTQTVDLRFNYVYSPTTSYFVSLNIRATDSDNPINQLNGGDSNSIGVGFVYTPRTTVQN
jgi:hypothetical protein